MRITKTDRHRPSALITAGAAENRALGEPTTVHRSVTIFRMANTTETYRRETADGSEIVTIMAYLGADNGDSDEIRRIVERDGTVVEDGIAYFGTSGHRWLEEQRSTYIAHGFESLPG